MAIFTASPASEGAVFGSGGLLPVAATVTVTTTASAAEQVDFQVKHGQPEPHRREHLDQGEPPVGEQQLESLEQHGDGAYGKGGGGEQWPGTAQPDNRLLHRRLVVVLDGAEEPPDLGSPGTAAQTGLLRAIPGPGIESRSIAARWWGRCRLVLVSFGGDATLPPRPAVERLLRGSPGCEVPPCASGALPPNRALQ
jgi:hypothetical protein